MKVYRTQSEVEVDIRNEVLAISGDVKFECDICIRASIVVNAGHITAGDINARDITAGDITARHINAWDITAGHITAKDINAGDINAWDITARYINAGDINARDITALDITAWDINAWDIVYYAFCCVYRFIKCVSIKAKREIHTKPICLEGKIIIKDPENEKKNEW